MKKSQIQELVFHFLLMFVGSLLFFYSKSTPKIFFGETNNEFLETKKGSKYPKEQQTKLWITQVEVSNN